MKITSAVCELGGGVGAKFLCDVYTNGGSGGLKYTWTTGRNSVITKNLGNHIQGVCRQGNAVGITVSVKDSSGATARRSIKPICTGDTPF